jgi:hypothetical protein
VPANAGSRIIFCQQHLCELLRRDPREVGGGLTERKQEWRNILGLTKRPLVEVVLPTVGHYPPLPDKSLKLELLKRELPHVVQQELLLFGG